MQKRTLKVALLAVLTVVLVLGTSTVALADQTWTDLPDYVTAKYGVTDNQVAAISEGYPGGLWKPFQSVTRAQFTKMAVAAFNIPLVNPAVASYTDVPKTDMYYQYIEGAKAAGVVNGTSATTFSPKANITRQQALAIVARYVADANGYDLATMYTAAEIDALLAHFGDAASISADLKDEMAFAFDFGLTVGNDYGNLDPLANLTRIQGAVLLIRAQAKVPPAQWTAAKVEITTADKAENLIGQAHPVTIKVTTADGHPAKQVLVDIDTLTGSDYYVGNISPQAAVTDGNGEVTVNLIATEPGTQRISATVAGVGTVYYTKYWVALDEVYMLCADEDEDYEYNAGTTTKALEARAVVFGPGPQSTSAQDWYNAYQPDATGALAAVDWPLGWILAELNSTFRSLLPIPGEDITMDDLDEVIDWAYEWAEAHDDLIWGFYEEFENVDSEEEYEAAIGDVAELVNLILGVDRWSCAVEKLAKDHGYVARGLAGVDMTWSIVNVVEDNPATKSKDETVPSVGDIVKVDGAEITAAKTAVGKTDATGKSSIELSSQVTGQTKVQVVADYAGNPYPGQLFNHLTHQVGLHFLDWDDQPYGSAFAVYTWIPHVIGGDTEGPISAAKLVNNTGEVEEFVLNLKDVYGNPIAGYTVTWWIEGVGFFKTDESSWTGIGEMNKDYDITDVTGKANVYVKSLVPGQTVVHCKVMDKYGSLYKEWNLTKQWYAIEDVEFTNKYVWTDLDDDGKVDSFEISIPVNMVGEAHTFEVLVSGAKYVHVLPDVNMNGLLDDAVLLGNRADIKAAKGAVFVMGATAPNQWGWVVKPAGQDILPGQVFTPDVEVDANAGPVFEEDFLVDPAEAAYYTRFADTALAGAEFWDDKYGYDHTEDEPAYDDGDGIDEVWSGLGGKQVYFHTNLGACIFESNTPLPAAYVGTITDPTTPFVLTDEMGKATVTVNSNSKGAQVVFAIADYLDNPQDGNPLKPYDTATDPMDGVKELQWDCAQKVWGHGDVCSDADVRVYSMAAREDNDPVSPLRWANYLNSDGENRDRIYVQVFDAFGNALEGFKVTFEIIGQGTTDKSGSCLTYHPFAHFDMVTDTTDELYPTPAHDWVEAVPGPYPTHTQYLTDYYDAMEDAADYWSEILGETVYEEDVTYNQYVAYVDTLNDIPHFAGVGDLNPFMNSNWAWGDFRIAGLDPVANANDIWSLDDPNDDDYAWGWTLNHMTNFLFSEASAAYADLVLDDEGQVLIDMLAGETICDITSIVNIKVYCPTGQLLKQYEVTKVWETETQALGSLVLLLGPTDLGPFGPSLTTSAINAWATVLAYDNYGQPTDATTDATALMLRIAGPGGFTYDLAAGTTNGVLAPTVFDVPLVPGAYTVTVWEDADGDGVLDVTEVRSAPCSLTVEP